jgi:20S proteasome alpha/beta subunit
MTLVAGVCCKDGFVIAADTELSYDDAILFQGHKLAVYDGKGLSYLLRIGYAGTASYGVMASQQVRDAVAGLKRATFVAIKAATLKVIKQIHDESISGSGVPVTPTVGLIIGVVDVEGRVGILKTEQRAVFEVEHYDFVGWGEQLARHVAQKLFGSRRLSAAATEHLVQQLFREIKGKAQAVGGNTEIISRRSSQDAEQFFDISQTVASDNPVWPKGLAQERADRMQARYLWGLESMLLSATRDALAQLYVGTFQARLKFILDGLEKLWQDAKRERKNTVLERRTTEYGMPYLNPFEDSLAPGAIPSDGV